MYFLKDYLMEVIGISIGRIDERGDGLSSAIDYIGRVGYHSTLQDVVQIVYYTTVGRKSRDIPWGRIQLPVISVRGSTSIKYK